MDSYLEQLQKRLALTDLTKFPSVKNALEEMLSYPRGRLIVHNILREFNFDNLSDAEIAVILEALNEHIAELDSSVSFPERMRHLSSFPYTRPTLMTSLGFRCSDNTPFAAVTVMHLRKYKKKLADKNAILFSEVRRPSSPRVASSDDLASIGFELGGSFFWLSSSADLQQKLAVVQPEKRAREAIEQLGLAAFPSYTRDWLVRFIVQSDYLEKMRVPSAFHALHEYFCTSNAESPSSWGLTVNSRTLSPGLPERIHPKVQVYNGYPDPDILGRLPTHPVVWNEDMCHLLLERLEDELQ